MAVILRDLLDITNMGETLVDFFHPLEQTNRTLVSLYYEGMHDHEKVMVAVDQYELALKDMEKKLIETTRKRQEVEVWKKHYATQDPFTIADIRRLARNAPYLLPVIQSYTYGLQDISHLYLKASMRMTNSKTVLLHDHRSIRGHWPLDRERMTKVNHDYILPLLCAEIQPTNSSTLKTFMLNLLRDMNVVGLNHLWNVYRCFRGHMQNVMQPFLYMGKMAQSPTSYSRQVKRFQHRLFTSSNGLKMCAWLERQNLFPDLSLLNHKLLLEHGIRSNEWSPILLGKGNPKLTIHVNCAAKNVAEEELMRAFRNVLSPLKCESTLLEKSCKPTDVLFIFTSKEANLDVVLYHITERFDVGRHTYKSNCLALYRLPVFARRIKRALKTISRLHSYL